MTARTTVKELRKITDRIIKNNIVKRTTAASIGIIIALVAIGCVTSIQYLADTATSQISPKPLTYPSITPSPKHTPYNQLTWQQYTNAKFGIAFLYPSNFTDISVTTNHIGLQRSYGDMVTIDKFDTTDSLDAWVQKKQTTIFPLTKTVTTFQRYPAYYIQFTSLPIIPMDFYIIKVNKHIYQIAYRATDQNKTAPQSTYSQDFTTVDKKAIDKILASIQFLK